MSQNNELLACYKVLSVLETASDNTETMLDNIPGVVVVLNKNLQVLRGNEEFAALCGRSMDTLLGFDFISLFSEENSSALQRHITRLRTNMRPNARMDFELEIIPFTATRQACQFYWQASLVKMPKSAEGDLISITGKDLSALYQSEMKLKSLFANLPLGMLIINAEGKISEVLAQYTEVLFDRSDLVGHTLANLLKDARNLGDTPIAEGLINFNECFGKSKMHYENIQKTLPCILAINYPDGSNTKWININYQPIFKASSVEGFILLIENATDSVLAQKEMERISVLERQIQAVYESAIRDPLTGLFTRLFMKDSLTSLIGNFSRGSIAELAVLLLDVDHFKNINDTYGHKIGDTILSAVGKIILQQVRDTDVAIRYGGEEFLIILPSNTSHKTSCRVVGDRIRAALADYLLTLESGETVGVKISGGGAWCRKDENINLAIERADGYLYEAKRSGRDRIITESGK